MISRSVGAVAVLTLFLLCCLSSSGAVGAAAPAWTTFGAGPARLGEAPAPASSSRVGRRFVLPLPGRITAQVLAADGVFVAATTNGDVVGLDRNGFVLWHDRLGQLANSCPQLNGYGVVSTGVIDPSSLTVYVMDGFGRLHALALGTGVERSGWPVRVFGDFDRELDWGALTLAAGSVYVPTAAYCDQPGTPGGIYRVDLASRGVTRWLAVPLDRGGGGGPWGWGGLAYDPAANSLFAGSSGAFSGGSNTGSAFTETAGFGERLIEFSTGLQIQSSSHPAGLPDRMDLDFVGSPLLVPGTSCGPMIVAATKNDTVYGWRRDAVAAGWAWKVAVEPYAVADPFVSQLAWSTATSSVYAVTGTELVRIKIGANCSASIVWRKPLGTHTENGSPTVAGNVVWFANNGTQKLVGYNATTGARVFSAPLGGTTLEAPAIVGGRLLIGTFTGLVEGFTTAREATPARHRGDQAHVDELGRRPARLAGTAGRRLRDRQCGQELAADLFSTGSRSRPDLADLGGHLDRVDPGRLHVLDAAALDERRGQELARHEDAQRELRRQRRSRLLLGGRNVANAGAAGRGERWPTRGTHGRVGAERDDRCRGRHEGGRRGARVGAGRRSGLGHRAARDRRERLDSACGGAARATGPTARTNHRGERQSSDRHRFRLHRAADPQADLDVNRRWVDLVGRLSRA